jgi:hypothetical protein
MNYIFVLGMTEVLNQFGRKVGGAKLKWLEDVENVL